MIKYTFICDSCHNEITGDPHMLVPETISHDAPEKRAPVQLFFQRQKDFHYCEDCINRALESLQPKRRKKNTVDTGKIMALYNADWKIKDIAGDAGIDEKIIRNVINGRKEA